MKAILNIPQAWAKAWSSSTFRNQFVLTVIFFIVVSLHNFHYLKVWQARPGVWIDDIFHSFLVPINFSIPIFMLEYTSLALVFTLLLMQPERLMKGLQAYGLVLFFRTVAIYFVALEPPRDMILLNDPVASLFLHTNDVFVTKDLFFSGHVSGLAIFFLMANNRFIKTYIAIATVLVSLFIVWQHVHYSFDVAFAPLASYVAYKLVYWLDPATRESPELQDA